MAYVASKPGAYRGGYRGSYGGSNNTSFRSSQDFQGRFSSMPVVAVEGSGDIFSDGSPKAYEPLGYGVLSEPVVLRPEDFSNDTPLPAYRELGCILLRLCYLIADSCFVFSPATTSAYKKTSLAHLCRYRIQEAQV